MRLSGESLNAATSVLLGKLTISICKATPGHSRPTDCTIAKPPTLKAAMRLCFTRLSPSSGKPETEWHAQVAQLLTICKLIEA